MVRNTVEKSRNEAVGLDNLKSQNMVVIGGQDDKNEAINADD